MEKLPKKISKHITPVEVLKDEGENYVEVIQDLYKSPEVQNYMPLSSDLVGEAPTVSDTSGVMVAPRRMGLSVTEQGQEAPPGASGQDRATPGSEAAVGPYTGPPEMAVYIPLTSPNTVSTQGKRMVPVRAPDQSDVYEFARFISAAYRAYIMEGRLYPETISRLSGIPIEKIGFYFRQEESNHALAIRGVSTEVHLTPEQDYVISILGDTSSKLNWNERMRRAGVSQAKLMAWRKNPVFDSAMKNMAEQVTANHDVALMELGRLVGEGQLRAIEKSLEISGRYNPAQQSTVDAIAIINRTVEVLAKHLSDDPEKLMAISRDLAAIQQDVRVIEHNNNTSIFGLDLG